MKLSTSDIFPWLKILGIVFVVDIVFLYSMKDIFSRQVMAVQGATVQMDWVAAIVCYLFIVTALYWFVIRPKASVLEAFLLGVCIYAVYELTNKALFYKWSYVTVVMDTIWGGTLFALSTYLYRLVE